MWTQVGCFSDTPRKSSNIPVPNKTPPQKDLSAPDIVDSIQMDTSYQISVETPSTPTLNQNLQSVSINASSNNSVPKRKDPDTVHRYPP